MGPVAQQWLHQASLMDLDHIAKLRVPQTLVDLIPQDGTAGQPAEYIRCWLEGIPNRLHDKLRHNEKLRSMCAPCP